MALWVVIMTTSGATSDKVCIIITIGICFCVFVAKGFFKLHDLQRHYTGLHSGARPFQCHVCGKAFPWARSLQDHLAAHQGSGRRRPFKCVDCDMTFVRRYDLNRHAITHTKQKPFICEWCGHGFTQKGSMDKHKRDFCRARPQDHKAIKDDWLRIRFLFTRISLIKWFRSVFLLNYPSRHTTQ